MYYVLTLRIVILAFTLSLSKGMRGSIQIIYIDSHFHGNDNEVCVT